MARRLAAILAADVVGYSKLMADDEAGTLAALKAHRRDLFDPQTAKHGGRIVKLMGDGVLVEFPSVVDAVECALAIQTALAAEAGKIRLRIGINLGDIIIDGDDIYGDGVNVAARLEALAEPGGIAVSGMVHEGLGNRVEADFTDAGEHQVKNIARPIRVWHWETGAQSPPPSPPARPIGEKPSIAVLPFNNMSSDPEQEHFADGLTEDIITALSHQAWFDVAARNSTFAYKGQSPDIRAVAQALGVAYVLEGSVRRGGERARITVQLIDAATGNHVWANRYDRRVDDEFAVQDEIAQRISSILGERIWQDGARNAGDKRIEDYSSLDFALRGVELLHRLNPGEMPQAIGFLDKALGLEKDLTLGHLGLGFCHLAIWGFWGSPTDNHLGHAHRHALTLLDLAADDAQTYRLLSRVYNGMGKYDEARECVERALSINPNDGDIIGNRGIFHLFLGDFDQAGKWIQKVLDLHADTPHTVDIMRYWKALAAFGAGAYEPAAALLGSVTGLDFIKSTLLAACHARMGHRDQATAAAAAVVEAYPDFSLARLGILKAFRKDDDRQHLFEALREAGLPE